MERTNPALAAVLQRQASASLAKRLSQASSIDYADAPGTAGIGERDYQLTLPESDMERLSSRSHTETAVWNITHTSHKNAAWNKKKVAESIQTPNPQTLTFLRERYSVCLILFNFLLIQHNNNKFLYETVAKQKKMRANCFSASDIFILP